MRDIESSLKKLLLDTAPGSEWGEICAIFLYDDGASKIKNYIRTHDGKWTSYSAGGFEIMDWFDDYKKHDPNIKSIKAVLSSQNNWSFSAGYETHEIFSHDNERELIDML